MMKNVVFFISLAMLLLFSTFSLFDKGNGQSRAVMGTAVQENTLAKAIMPTRMEIPSIKLVAPIEPVSLLANGQMGAPASFKKAGMLVPWTKPGEKGTAVIAGHFDHYTGPAIFYDLRKLKPGDQVFLYDKTDQKLVFTVKAVESFPTKEAPVEKIFSNTSAAQLNLITCDGKFNRKRQEHNRRLVVFTELAS
ncbi:class F sortase [Aneurinibacillus sp. BA2021]|nr:class F sortase [Aneurinibacillus sp. BA2021]